MKRNSHNNFRKNRIKSIDSSYSPNEKDKSKNKLEILKKNNKCKKTTIDKRVSDILKLINRPSSFNNNNSGKINNVLKRVSKSNKKKSYEKQGLMNHLVSKNNNLTPGINIDDLLNKSSRNVFDFNNKDKLKLTSINFNFNLNKNSLGEKKKEKFNLLPRGSKKDNEKNRAKKLRSSYENILLNMSKNNIKRKSDGQYKNFEKRRSSLNLVDRHFLMYRGSKQVEPSFKTRRSLENSNINILDLHDNKDKIKLIEMRQNIQNEIGSKELKKKVKQMKKVIIKNSIIEFQKDFDLKELIEEQSSITIEQSEKLESKIAVSEGDCHQITYKSNIQLIEEENKIEKIKNKERFRFIKRRKELYDSFDDEEFEDQTEINYYISPSNYFIKIFDLIVFFASMIYFIYVPILFSENLIFFSKKSDMLLMSIDIIYILDLIFNFFRAYQNFDESLVSKRKYIFLHYLSSWFFIDFIQSIPFFTLFKYMDKLHLKNQNKFYNSQVNEYNKVNRLLYLIIMVKIIKLYKMLHENITMFKIGEIISKIEIIDDYGYLLFSLFYSITSINLCACIFIFIGTNSHPGWLIKINIQDEPYIDKYITSVYYILVTITTVGYGDITGSSYPDIIYQMFLLIIGTIAYSFVISYFSNYIVKINQKSITFQKNVGILEEIRLHHPNLDEKLYQEILKNLYIEQLYEKNDKNILFDCLPLTLKNKLIMEMYKDFINNFTFFKDNHHSDFIVKVVTSLKPLLTFKNDTLIQEGDYVKEIFFVKKGVLVLNITIDKDNPEESINKYLNFKERGRISISYLSPTLLGDEKEKDVQIYERVNTYLINNANKEINNHKKKHNISEIKIIEIHKNEHFGDALLFLNEKSPLVLKVKSKVSELLVLRKMEAIEIYSVYPHLWKRINRKSIYNMEQIKKRIKKELYLVSKRYGTTKVENMLSRTRTIKRYFNYANCQNKIDKNKNKESSENKEENENKENSDNKEEKENKESSENKEYKENKEKSENEMSKKEERKSDEENSTGEKEEKEEKDDKNDKKSNNKTDIKRKANFDNNKIKALSNKNINKKIVIIQTPDLIDKKSVNSKNKPYEKELKINSLEASDSVKSKIKESNKRKPNEFIFKIYNSNMNKSQKSTNKFLKVKSSKNNFKNSNLTSKIKSDNIIDLSNRGENDNFSFLENDNKSRISNIKNEKKEFVFNSFSNLSKINEGSFHIKSLYENLNILSHNKYGSSSALQMKIKDILTNERPLIHHSFSKINNFSKGHKSKILSKFNTLKDFKNLLDKEEKKSNNSLDESKLKSYRNTNNNDNESKVPSFNTSKKEFDTENLSLKQFNTCSRFQSGKFSNKNISLSPRKVRRKLTKKKVNEFGMNKKLDIINQNIQGANKNINNPEEFYMDFFNDIIKKETVDFKKEEKNIHKSENFKSANFMSDLRGKKNKK